mmetsp:Transcript_35000/g.88167  ORF Transcript_35000/g.88167 Transcript_35000/m.88167 type:complete len:193 (+) Transcript_35000:357-935(+)
MTTVPLLLVPCQLPVPEHPSNCILLQVHQHECLLSGSQPQGNSLHEIMEHCGQSSYASEPPMPYSTANPTTKATKTQQPATVRKNRRLHVARQCGRLLRRSRKHRELTKPMARPKVWAKLSTFGIVPNNSCNAAKMLSQSSDRIGVGWQSQFMNTSPTDAPITPKIAPEAPTDSVRGMKVAVATLPKMPESM